MHRSARLCRHSLVPTLRFTRSTILAYTRNLSVSSIRQEDSDPAEATEDSGDGPARPSFNITVRPDHPLYAFFKKKKTDTGETIYSSIDSPRDPVTGRAWKAHELRRKSFQDLHTLWYVMLRERNRMDTQREELRRIGFSQTQFLPLNKNRQSIKKGMGAIKFVLNERRLAYQGAVDIFKAKRKELLEKTAEAEVKATEVEAWVWSQLVQMKGQTLKELLREKGKTEEWWQKRMDGKDEEEKSRLQTMLEEARRTVAEGGKVGKSELTVKKVGKRRREARKARLAA